MVSCLIFQKFSGEGLIEPLLRPLPPLFLGLRSRFGLRPQILERFAPSTRASPSILWRFARLDSGFALNFRLGTLAWPPKINFWIRQWTCWPLLTTADHCWPLVSFWARTQQDALESAENIDMHRMQKKHKTTMLIRRMPRLCHDWRL